MTLTKNIPLGSEKAAHEDSGAGAYNVFNHTEILGINTGVNYNATTNQVTNLPTLGYINGASNSRILAFTARIEF